MLVFGQVFIESVGWVDGLIFFGGIFTRILEYDLGSARVLWRVKLSVQYKMTFT
jgi:hypothetical protein